MSKIKDLLWKTAPNTQPAPQQSVVINVPSAGISAQIISVPSGVPDTNLIQDYVKKIEDYLKTRNQPGFDSWEFIQMLYKLADNPQKEHFLKVLELAETLYPDSQITAAFLLQSIAVYKQDIQKVGQEGLNAVLQQQSNLQIQKDQKTASLQSELKSAEGEIASLQQKLAEANIRKSTAASTLSTIDTEFASPLLQLTNKQVAIQSAITEVNDSFVEVENGIKTFLIK